MNGKPQHTPGPWYVKDRGGHGVSVETVSDSACNIAPQDAYVVAEVYNAGPECGQEECRQEAHANARLIAAAPELYALLHEAFQLMPVSRDDRRQVWAVRALKALREAA